MTDSSTPSPHFSGRRRLLTSAGILTLAVFFVTYGFSLAHACSIADVTGFVDCVTRVDPQHNVAWFGYYDSYAPFDQQRTISQPIGAQNGFLINGKWQSFPGQPTVFHYNVSHFVFGVPFDKGGSLTWSVGNQKVTVNDSFATTCSTTTPTGQAATQVGQPVTLHADVTITSFADNTAHPLQFNPMIKKPQSGSVVFLQNGSPLGPAAPVNSSGQATLQTTSLTPGQHDLTAVYTGDQTFPSGQNGYTNKPYASWGTTGQSIVQVGAGCTIAAQTPSAMYSSNVSWQVTLTATGAVAPTGDITFSDGGSVLGTAHLTNSKATFATTALEVGDHTITASYVGDANYQAANCSTPQNIGKIPTATLVSSSENPSTAGQPVTFDAQVQPSVTLPPNVPALTGTVTFVQSSNTLGTTSTTGAKVTTLVLDTGSHPVGASYSGDNHYAPSDSNLTQVVTTTATPPTTGTDQSFIRIAQASADHSSVNVTIDNTAFNNLADCTIQNYTPIPAGTHTVTISDTNGPILTKSLNFIAGNYSTLALIGNASANPAVADELVVFADDVALVPDKAKVRVYHLDDGLGPVTVAANSTVVVGTLDFKNASNYLIEAPGVVTYQLAPQSSAPALTSAIDGKALHVYSLVAMCSKIAVTDTPGVPTGLPNTGSPIIETINWPAIAALMTAMLVLGGGIGGVAGFVVLRVRRSR